MRPIFGRFVGLLFGEFIGLPHGGKSTLIKALAHHLYLKGYFNQSIRRDRGMPDELIHRENYFDRELLVLTEAVSEIIRYQDSSLSEAVFIHRGPWDAIAFYESLARSGRISKAEAKTGISFAKENTFRIDCVVLVKISPEESLARASPSTLDSEVQRDLVRDPDFLKILFQAYEELRVELLKKLPDNKFLIVDGTRPEKENLETLLKLFLPLLDEQRHFTETINRNCQSPV